MTHAIVSIVFLVLLLLVANPFDFWMPTTVQYLSVAAVAVVGALYAGLIYKERPRDEREESLRGNSGRAAYLVGVGVLILGVVVPILNGGHPSLWVLGALAAMVVAKVLHNAMSS